MCDERFTLAKDGLPEMTTGVVDAISTPLIRRSRKADNQDLQGRYALDKVEKLL